MKMNYPRERLSFSHQSSRPGAVLKPHTITGAVQFSYLSNGMTDLVAAPVTLIILCNSVGIRSTERPANNVCAQWTRTDVECNTHFILDYY